CEELAARIRKATARRCRAAGAEGDGSAAPRPKTATVERREASVPRHGTQGASLGAWRAAAKARSRASLTQDGTPHGCSAEHPNGSRRSAPPPIRGGGREVATPGRRNAPRERGGLFDIVRWELRRTVRRRAASSAVLILSNHYVVTSEDLQEVPRATTVLTKMRSLRAHAT